MWGGGSDGGGGGGSARSVSVPPSKSFSEASSPSSSISSQLSPDRATVLSAISKPMPLLIDQAAPDSSSFAASINNGSREGTAGSGSMYSNFMRRFSSSSATMPISSMNSDVAVTGALNSAIKDTTAVFHAPLSAAPLSSTLSTQSPSTDTVSSHKELGGVFFRTSLGVDGSGVGKISSSSIHKDEEKHQHSLSTSPTRSTAPTPANCLSSSSNVIVDQQRLSYVSSTLPIQQQQQEQQSLVFHVEECTNDLTKGQQPQNCNHQKRSGSWLGSLVDWSAALFDGRHPSTSTPHDPLPHQPKLLSLQHVGGSNTNGAVDSKGRDGVIVASAHASACAAMTTSAAIPPWQLEQDSKLQAWERPDQGNVEGGWYHPQHGQQQQVISRAEAANSANIMGGGIGGVGVGANSGGGAMMVVEDETMEKEQGFVGHYILLIGYDCDSDGFLYRDPGTQEPMCIISGKDLELARSSLGTDLDTIIVKATT